MKGVRVGNGTGSRAGLRTFGVGCLAALAMFGGCGDDGVSSVSDTVVELSGVITEDMTLWAERKYLLTGQTFVQSGVTLTVEPGTVVKGLPYDKIGRASVLVIKPGAVIVADGTVRQPITFTTAFDGAVLPRRGLWGGLVILGRAPVNQPGGEAFVEGLAGVRFGGDEPDDSSGVLRYVRVWYGGREIGDGNEINGITFAGVGRRTIVEHCEVAWNNDDGFEFFGGTVDVKYLSAAFCADDCFDTDWGYRGRGQFLFGLMGRDVCGRGFEMDNDGGDMAAQPRSRPMFCNVTLIGPGGGMPAGDGGDDMIRLREGTAGDFRNMVIVNGNGVGVRVKDSETLGLMASSPVSADVDYLYFSPNSIIHGCAAAPLHEQAAEVFSARFVSPLLGSVVMTLGEEFVDPRPRLSGPAFESVDTPADVGFFTVTAHVGAFATELWLKGWSWLDEHNRLP